MLRLSTHSRGRIRRSRKAGEAQSCPRLQSCYGNLASGHASLAGARHRCFGRAGSGRHQGCSARVCRTSRRCCSHRGPTRSSTNGSPSRPLTLSKVGTNTSTSCAAAPKSGPLAGASQSLTSNCPLASYFPNTTSRTTINPALTRTSGSDCAAHGTEGGIYRVAWLHGVFGSRALTNSAPDSDKAGALKGSGQDLRDFPERDKHPRPSEPGVAVWLLG